MIGSEKVAAGVLAGMKTDFKAENSWETTADFNPDREAGKSKRAKTWSKKMMPKEIL
jgi:cardiolipin synthase C